MHTTHSYTNTNTTYTYIHTVDAVACLAPVTRHSSILKGCYTLAT